MHFACFVVAILLLSSCATTSPKRRNDPVGSSLDNESIRDVPVRGCNATLLHFDKSTSEKGELLSISRSSIYILSDETQLKIVPLHKIRAVRCSNTFATAGAIGAWLLIGGATTISHGFVLIITAPAWALATAIALASDGLAPRHTDFFVPVDLEYLRDYARYPQGLADYHLRALYPQPEVTFRF